MDDPKRLEPIIKLAEQKKSDAGRRLASARDRQTTDQQQLNQLQEFLAEYSVRFEQAAGAGMNAQQLRDYRIFLSNIDNAIAQKKQDSVRADRKVEESRHDWLEKHQRTEALIGAHEHMVRQQVAQRARREQKETDDRVGAVGVKEPYLRN
tara:strand:- start:9896 stop:10348 length:453 start_codon:yes stop_codon:yes gene_type:complete